MSLNSWVHYTGVIYSGRITERPRKATIKQNNDFVCSRVIRTLQNIAHGYALIILSGILCNEVAIQVVYGPVAREVEKCHVRLVPKQEFDRLAQRRPSNRCMIYLEWTG